MKKLIVLLVFSISTIAFSQSKERISLHVFDLPAGITIEEFQNDLDRANKIYEKNGFGANNVSTATTVLNQLFYKSDSWILRWICEIFSVF